MSAINVTRHVPRSRVASIIGDNPAWMDEGVCASTDPELWFPEKGGSVSQAKRVCAGCPVRNECLEYALANHESFGIWGGWTERERRTLRKERAA